MNKPSSLVFALCVSLMAVSLANSEELPKFFGIYANQNGKYIEVKKQNSGFSKSKYNCLKRTMTTDCNIKILFAKNNFLPIDKNEFNKNGFTVIHDPETSEYNLYSPVANDPDGNNVIIYIGYEGSSGFHDSTKGLDEMRRSNVIALKKGKVGENAFIYVPETPLPEGYYFIGYKKNGENIDGYHAFLLK